jgi:hypothetical protein
VRVAARRRDLVDLLHLAGACAVLAAGLWASSGTLAPYAATLAKPRVWGACNYLLNIDHQHFKAVFLMLDGAPREQWEFSVVLRRVLHPLLAWPLMKSLGFGAGGFLANLLLSVGSVVFFWRSLRRRFGEDLPHAGLWLLATWPGFFYWGGLPYSYALIVPLSLVGMTVLWRLGEATHRREALLHGLLLGALATGYDLLPFFGFAGVLILLYRRLWGLLAAFIPALIAPLAVVVLLEKTLYGVPIHNSNTAAYGNILRSWLTPWDLTPEEVARWKYLLGLLPRTLLDVFLWGGLLFVPLLFLLCLAASWRLPRGRRSPDLAVAAVLVAATAVFLFNNLAPPYPGWQLRGSWLARLYQPVAVAMIAYLAVFSTRVRLLSPGLRAGFRAAAALAVAGHLWIVAGPFLGSTGLTQTVYQRFYRHDRPGAYSDNLARYGARPLGFCRGGPIPAAAPAPSIPSNPASVRH